MKSALLRLALYVARLIVTDVVRRKAQESGNLLEGAAVAAQAKDSLEQVRQVARL